MCRISTEAWNFQHRPNEHFYNQKVQYLKLSIHWKV